MRIAFFTDTYFPNTDGVVTAINNYRQELERTGHEVFIFSPGTKKQKEENSDERVHYFTSTSFKPYPNYKIAVFNFFSPIKLIKDLKVDVIHSHGIATTGLASIQSSRKLGIPAIATFHTMVPEAVHYITEKEQLRGILQNIAWKYLTWYYSSFKKVIAPSNFVKTELEAHGIKNVVLQPAGIDCSKFNERNPAGLRKKFGLTKKNQVILYLGRIAKEKSIELIVEQAHSILNILPDAKFIIAGKGPAENYYKDLVKSRTLENNFIFPGYIKQEELSELYSLADVFAFPSAFDTQGLAVLEAMSTGTAPVLKKNSAPSEFIEDGRNGFIFGDHFDFSEKTVLAIKKKKDLKEWTVKTAHKFDIVKMTEDLVNIYKGVVTK